MLNAAMPGHQNPGTTHLGTATNETPAGYRPMEHLCRAMVAPQTAGAPSRSRGRPTSQHLGGQRTAYTPGHCPMTSALRSAGRWATRYRPWDEPPPICNRPSSRWTEDRGSSPEPATQHNGVADSRPRTANANKGRADAAHDCLHVRVRGSERSRVAPCLYLRLLSAPRPARHRSSPRRMGRGCCPQNSPSNPTEIGASDSVAVVQGQPQ